MILVTGASGFVGRALIPVLEREGPVATAPRDLPPSFRGITTVVHLAARVHVMRETASDPLDAFRRVNLDLTRSLAETAAASGVKRFIYISTAKVNGEQSGSTCFRDTDNPQPQDPYARSKWEAEQELARITASSSMEVVILRPPLIYGPEVKGNFLTLLKLCRLAPPLPLAAIENRRSLLYLGNLTDAIAAVARAPLRGGCHTHLLADGEALSTPELLRGVSQALGRPCRLFPVPPALLRGAAALLGKKPVIDRLLDSLAIEDSPFRESFSWSPPHSVEAGLAATAAWFNSPRPST